MTDGQGGTTTTVAATAGAADLLENRLAVEEAIQASNQRLVDAMQARGDTGLKQLQGFFAEHWHAETWEIDAVRKRVKETAVDVLGRTSRGSPDLAATDGTEWCLKYWKTPSDTAKQLWDPHYGNQIRLVPTDQLEGVTAHLRRGISDNAHRPDVARAAAISANNVTDHVQHDGASSTPLSRGESERLAALARDGEAPIEPESMRVPGNALTDVGVAAGVAGAIAFASAAGPVLMDAVRTWYNGSPDEARRLLREGAGRGASAAGWAALKASLATVLLELASASPALSADPTAIGAVAAVAVGAIRDGLAWRDGEIDGREFAQRTLASSVVAGGGAAGAAIGQALIPVPVVGAVIGSLVGSLVARVGLAAARWVTEKVGPALADAWATLADVLVGWQLAVELERKKLIARYAEAQAVVHQVRVDGFNLFAELSIEPFDLVAGMDRIAANDRMLEQLEAEAARQLDEP